MTGWRPDFVSGLALTLGDIKASLFPAFVDIPALGTADIAIVMGITILAVGGVKIAYAFAAKTIASVSRGFTCERPARIATGGLMIDAGGYLIAKT